MVLDEPKESDDVFVIDDVKFVADKDFGFIIEGLEIVKFGAAYAVAQTSSCC